MNTYIYFYIITSISWINSSISWINSIFEKCIVHFSEFVPAPSWMRSPSVSSSSAGEISQKSFLQLLYTVNSIVIWFSRISAEAAQCLELVQSWKFSRVNLALFRTWSLCGSDPTFENFFPGCPFRQTAETPESRTRIYTPADMIMHTHAHT